MKLKAPSISRSLDRFLFGVAALLQGFRSPPEETRPTVWCCFMDDHVTREGITADLDFMTRVGLSRGIVSFCSSRTKPSETQPDSTQAPILSNEWCYIMPFQLDRATWWDLDLWFQASPCYAPPAAHGSNPNSRGRKWFGRMFPALAGRDLMTSCPFLRWTRSGTITATSPCWLFPWGKLPSLRETGSI